MSHRGSCKPPAVVHSIEVLYFFVCDRIEPQKHSFFFFISWESEYAMIDVPCRCPPSAAKKGSSFNFFPQIVDSIRVRNTPNSQPSKMSRPRSGTVLSSSVNSQRGDSAPTTAASGGRANGLSSSVAGLAGAAAFARRRSSTIRPVSSGSVASRGSGASLGRPGGGGGATADADGGGVASLEATAAAARQMVQPVEYAIRSSHLNHQFSTRVSLPKVNILSDVVAVNRVLQHEAAAASHEPAGVGSSDAATSKHPTSSSLTGPALSFSSLVSKYTAAASSMMAPAVGEGEASSRIGIGGGAGAASLLTAAAAAPIAVVALPSVAATEWSVAEDLLMMSLSFAKADVVAGYLHAQTANPTSYPKHAGTTIWMQMGSATASRSPAATASEAARHLFRNQGDSTTARDESLSDVFVPEESALN